jgi:hypothetical protein
MIPSALRSDAGTGEAEVLKSEAQPERAEMLTS